MALTGSATKEDQEHIRKGLSLAPNHVFLTESFNRPNLRYTVLRKPGQKFTLAIAKYIEDKHPGESGIVYCIGRSKCEEVAANLRAFGVRAEHFHGIMPASEKQATMNSWLADECDVIVATVSVDKQWLLHCY